MNRVIPSLVASLVLTTGLFAQTPKITFPAASPSSALKQRVGLTDVEIVYSRPSAKGRTVFGGLVPYGEVWRTGANASTKITFSTAVKLNGVGIPAGTYALYTIPGRTEWTVIIDKDTSLWGAYAYDAKNDLVRFTATPETMPGAFESFTIGINDLRDESATIYLMWEKTRVPIKLEVSVVAPIVAEIDAAMASAGKKPYAQAAQFYLEHNLDLNKALAWVDASLAEKPAFNVFYLKATILAKTGDKAGAIAAANRAIELAAKAEGPVKKEYTRLSQHLISSLH